jgi:chromosome segregation ATPase
MEKAMIESERIGVLYQTIKNLWWIVGQRDETIEELRSKINGMKITADSAEGMIRHLGRERTTLAEKLESESKSSMQALDIQQERIRELEGELAGYRRLAASHDKLKELAIEVLDSPISSFHGSTTRLCRALAALKAFFPDEYP